VKPYPNWSDGSLLRHNPGEKKLQDRRTETKSQRTEKMDENDQESEKKAEKKPAF